MSRLNWRRAGLEAQQSVTRPAKSGCSPGDGNENGQLSSCRVPDTALSKNICEFIPYHNPMTYWHIRNEAQKSTDIMYQQPSSPSTYLLTLCYSNRAQVDSRYDLKAK